MVATNVSVELEVFFFRDGARTQLNILYESTVGEHGDDAKL
jgi:hypothetical protein